MLIGILSDNKFFFPVIDTDCYKDIPLKAKAVSIEEKIY